MATSNLKTAMRNYQLINASASNPLDMTSSIVNNSFESGMSGWNNNGFKTQTNIYFPLKDRNTYAEKWVNRGQQVGSGSVSQTLTNLPNGKYIMSAAAGNIQQNGAESSENSGDPQTGAYLYAGFSRQPVTDIKVYDNIAFSVIDGAVTLGFAAENASGNWLTLDNFSLKYVGKNTAADLNAYLNAYIDEIRSFMEEAHVQSWVKEICNETIAEVQDDLNDQLTEEKAIQDKGNLDWAYEQLKISAKKFAKLSEAIEYATKVTEWYADEPAKIAPLLTAIETAKAQYADLSLTDEGFFLAISELEKVTKTVDKGFYTAEWSMGNVQDPNNKYYVGRTRQSKNWILFWEKEYGEDPETFTCGNYTLDIDEVLRRADKAFDFYTDVLKYIKRGSSKTDNLKMVIRLRYEPTEWEATGSGIDDKIGLLTLTPWATPSRNWQTLYHEVGHCFQYQVHCDNNNHNGWMYEPGNGKGCAFWEQCAQWQAYKIMPEEQFTNEWFSGYLANVHKHILHESPRYNNYFVQDYWTYLHGIEFMGRLWNESKYPEDAVEAYMRITGISVSEFYDEMYDCAARFATWDIPALEKYGKSKITSRPQPSMSKTEDSGWRINASVAPENTGHNIIRLNKPSEAKLVAATFRGLNNAEGYRVKNADQAEWRYGFVAELKDGQRIYGPMGKSDYNNPDGKIWLECPDNVNRLWFIVSGGSKKYWRQVWDDNDNNDEQWPYEVVFHNTNKSGTPDNIGVDGIFDIEEAPELPELVFDGKMLTIGSAEKNYTVVITDLTGYTVAKVNTTDVAQTVTLNSGVYIINTLNAEGQRVDTRKVLCK